MKCNLFLPHSLFFSHALSLPQMFLFHVHSCLSPSGFFGDLLTLVCQNFSMVDLVLLLHGQNQPLGRIQTQLSQFFTQHYLNGSEPTDHNVAVSGPPSI